MTRQLRQPDFESEEERRVFIDELKRFTSKNSPIIPWTQAQETIKIVRVQRLSRFPVSLITHCKR